MALHRPSWANSTHGSNSTVLPRSLYCLEGGDTDRDGYLKYSGSEIDLDRISVNSGSRTLDHVQVTHIPDATAGSQPHYNPSTTFNCVSRMSPIVVQFRNASVR